LTGLGPPRLSFILFSFEQATRQEWLSLSFRSSRSSRSRTRYHPIQGINNSPVTSRTKVKNKQYPSSGAACKDRSPPHRWSDVIAQMFEWDWASVAVECTNFLGPAGYGFVQGKVINVRPSFQVLMHFCTTAPLVSPAQEHVQGPEWWTDYQPVSYILTSKRGDRSQYQAMIATCHAAGVKVIAGQSKMREQKTSHSSISRMHIQNTLTPTFVCVQIRYGTTCRRRILGLALREAVREPRLLLLTYD